MKIDINRYIGKWFEIAKIPNMFQPDMTNIVAEYATNNDATIKVTNSGYVNGKLKQIVGTAKLTDKDDLLKVSFFPNIYSDYRILGIDKDYQYAVVGGSNKDFLWILSRYNKIDKEIFEWLVDVARKEGYNVDKLEITK